MIAMLWLLKIVCPTTFLTIDHESLACNSAKVPILLLISTMGIRIAMSKEVCAASELSLFLSNKIGKDFTSKESNLDLWNVLLHGILGITISLTLIIKQIRRPVRNNVMPTERTDIWLGANVIGHFEPPQKGRAREMYEINRPITSPKLSKNFELLIVPTAPSLRTTLTQFSTSSSSLLATSSLHTIPGDSIPVTSASISVFELGSKLTVNANKYLLSAKSAVEYQESMSDYSDMEYHNSKVPQKIPSVSNKPILISVGESKASTLKLPTIAEEQSSPIQPEFALASQPSSTLTFIKDKSIKVDNNDESRASTQKIYKIGEEQSLATTSETDFIFKQMSSMKFIKCKSIKVANNDKSKASTSSISTTAEEQSSPTPSESAFADQPSLILTMIEGKSNKVAKDDESIASTSKISAIVEEQSVPTTPETENALQQLSSLAYKKSKKVLEDATSTTVNI